MKRKPIKVDWDELETAFDQRDAEQVYYLDRITGHVLLVGEGEEKRFTSDDNLYGREEREDAAQPEDATRAYIRPVTTEQKLEWVRRFIDEVGELDPEFRSALAEALNADGPAEAVIDVLNRNPEGKERWYLFRGERLHDAVETWVEAQGILVSEPPPWK